MKSLFKKVSNNQFKLNESDYLMPNELKLTKVEEAEALNFLRKVVIPKWVEYVKLYHITGHEYITSELVNKNLKKIKDQPSIKHFFSKYIEEKDTPGVEGNYFSIEKRFDENQQPIIVASYYTSGDDFYVEFDLNTGQQLNENDIEDIEKDIEKKNKLRKIDKLEEDQALNFIKKVVVPKLVQRWNEFVNQKHSEGDEYGIPVPINVSDVLLTLRKTSKTKAHSQYNLYAGDHITYETGQLGKRGDVVRRVQFYMVKRSYDGISYDTFVGYHDPFENTLRDFRVGGIYL